ncbi:MAG: coenzyme F420-0:L-glutamate ligase [Proteobacteria bacterium]|nr:coenzyme F420-0:L-glutamate ligase [Pseudomonadota bacterium]
MSGTAALTLYALHGLPEVRATSPLARLLGDALVGQALRPTAADILVVAQKIVSKAEGRLVDLATVQPGARALELARATGKDPRLVELILAESSEVLRARTDVLIVRHRLGFVMANAGIDRSNVDNGTASTTGSASGPGPEHVLLLPRDPDASAAALRAALRERFAVAPGVIISDSFGRPWRRGVVNIALGAAGVASLHDRRGEGDRRGRPLQVTEVALGDALAAAAGLVMGEAAESIPAVLIRGFSSPGEARPAQALIRPLQEDLFR